MSEKRPLVIWGASGHGKVAADIARAMGVFELVGFVDEDPAKAGEFLGLSVRGEAGDWRGLAGVEFFLAIGNNAQRLRRAEELKRQGVRFARLIHPRATVAGDVEMGEGTLVAAGAVINPGTVIGAQCIVNTLAGVDHDCVLEEGVHVCPGAHVAGRVRVGRGAMIGVGASVRDGVRIGEFAVVGAGAAVVEDVPGRVVVVGVPARRLRENDSVLGK